MSRMNILPNFYIVGAPKAGTSSLFTWIADHPDALGSHEKETYFFVDPGTHMYRPDFNVANGIEDYHRQFDGPSGVSAKVVLEATPGYMYMQNALDHIPDLETEPKCLFILREPSSQIYSLYEYFRNNWSWIPAEMTFAEYLSAVRSGSRDIDGNELARNAISNASYVDHLIPWRNRLGEARMLALTFDDLCNNPVAVVKRVANWLNLDEEFYDAYDFPQENKTYVPRNRQLQKLNVLVRGMLPKGRFYDRARDIYRKFNTKGHDAPDDETIRALFELREEFSEDNFRLEKEFGLDLRNWSLPYQVSADHLKHQSARG